MPRPHKSTVDALVDTFDRFDIEVQESVLDQLTLVHRLAKRRAGKQPEAPRDTVVLSDAAQAALKLQEPAQ